MNCPPIGNEADLVGYWNMDEGTGTTLTDLSGNGNDGIINGATWSNDTPTQICDNCTTSDSIYVEILDVDIVQNDTTICQGDSIELSVVLFEGSLNNDLLAYYPFNGNANDETGNGNNGTNNGATLTPDRFGNLNSAYNFPGICDSGININLNNTSNNVGYAVSLWVNKSGDGCYDPPRIFHFNEYPIGGPSYNLDVLDALWYFNSNSPRYFNGNIANNNWAHLVFSHNGDTLFTYLNGNLDKAEPNTDVLNLNSELSIGKTSFYSGRNGFHGLIDDFGIWTRPLNNEEIQELYNSQSN
jgi:hypothetical protein